jgi:hypothetical protein
MTVGRIMSQSGRKLKTEPPRVPQTSHAPTGSGWREIRSGAINEMSAGAVNDMRNFFMDIKVLCRYRKLWREGIISALPKFIGEILLA